MSKPFDILLRDISLGVFVKRKGFEKGERHPLAKLTDLQVIEMRKLYEAAPKGAPEHIGYRKLAQLFKCHKNTVRDICKYRYR